MVYMYNVYDIYTFLTAPARWFVILSTEGAISRREKPKITLTFSTTTTMQTMVMVFYFQYMFISDYVCRVCVCTMYIIVLTKPAEMIRVVGFQAFGGTGGGPGYGPLKRRSHGRTSLRVEFFLSKLIIELLFNSLSRYFRSIPCCILTYMV